MWAPQIFLLRPGAIGPMESARYQGYKRSGASSAFWRVIWNIKRQNIFVCSSDVTHVTIHDTVPLTHLVMFASLMSVEEPTRLG